jgi:Abnormal spindle-like microcephaly-assoc'd, ASPM-SPD-2-Hydin
VSNPKDPKKKPGFTVLMEGLAGAESPFIVANGCNAPLPPGQSCVIGVTFAPTVPGTFTATLTIIDNAEFGRRSVNVKGKGK